MVLTSLAFQRRWCHEWRRHPDIVNYTTPPPPTAFSRALDSFVALPGRLRLPLAVLAALLIHGLVVVTAWIWPLVMWLLLGTRPDAETPLILPPTPAPLEVVLQPTPTPQPEKEKLTPVEEKKLEELFAALPPEAQREYLDVDGLAQRKNMSKRALLESWQDSVAGSRKPGKGGDQLPSQDGRTDLPFTNFKDQQAAVGDPKNPAAAALENLPPTKPSPNLPGADSPPLFKPQPVSPEDIAAATPNNIPKVAEVAKPTPTPKPTARPTPPPDLKEVAMAKEDEIPLYVRNKELTPALPNLDPAPPPAPIIKPEPVAKPAPAPPPTPAAKPTPAPLPTPAPTQPPKKESVNTIVAAKFPQQPGRPIPVANPGYSPHQAKRKIEGGNVPGEDGVDAVATAKGRYMKAMNSIIGSRWTHYLRDPKHSSLITEGKVTVRFSVNARGKLLKAQVVDNTSNPAHAALCERAIFESQVDFDAPPSSLLIGGVFEDTFTFILY
jgi:hypothetical protein